MSGNAPKIVIVVLVVVVVLFVLGIGVGAGGGIGGISLDGVISRFSGLFPAPAVSIDQIDASPTNCLDPNLQRIIVPVSGSCRFSIAATSDTIRALKLQLQSGTHARLEMTSEPVEDKSMTVKTDLQPGDKDHATLDIYKSGGTLIIDQCTSGSSACIIDLVG